MRKHDTTHFEQVVALVAEAMATEPNISINQLCRIVTGKVAASKDLVSQARRKVRQAVRKAPVATFGDAALVHVKLPVTLQRPRPPIALIPSKVETSEAPAPAEPMPTEEVVEVMTPVPEPVQGRPAAPSKPHPLMRGAQQRAEKRQYVNELLDADPGLDPQIIIGKLKERFRSSLDHRYIYDTCRIARELHQLPQLPLREPHARVDTERRPLPTFEAPVVVAGPAPELDTDFAATPEEDLQWLAEQARDIMRAHQLGELVLTLTPVGAEWEFKVLRTGRGTLKF